MNSINKLLEVMARLRDPDKGCPWDLAQDFRSIAPYTIEEAYEVAQAIDHGDMDELCQELGDLLLQVVFHARMAEEAGAFDFGQVAAAIVEKMLRRHPHVFGDEQLDTAAAQSAAWEVHKAQERAAAGQQRVLDGVGLGLPSLLRTDKLCKRAARVGFDWPDADGPRAKIAEELAELAEAEAAGDQAAMLDEMGDLLFAAANLARKHGINPEEALRGANRKFARRFTAVEDGVNAAGGDWSAHDLASLDALWEQAKRAESSPGR